MRWEAAVPGSDEIALVRGIAALRNREIDEARQWLTLAAGQRDSANSVAQLARWILGLQNPSQQTRPGSPEWSILGSPTTGLTDPPERFLGRLVLTAWQRAMEKDPTLAFPLNLTEATPPETNP